MADDIGRSNTKEESRRRGISRSDFERLYPKLVSRFLMLGTSQEEARDLVQSTLLVAHQGMQSFEHRSELDTWVFSIAKNQWLHYLRSQQRLKRKVEEVSLNDEHLAQGPLNEGDLAKDAEHSLIARDHLTQVSKEIRALPEEQQQSLVLSIQGFKYREIGQVLGISENRVSSLIHQARRKLRRQLGTASVGIKI